MLNARAARAHPPGPSTRTSALHMTLQTRHPGTVHCSTSTSVQRCGPRTGSAVAAAVLHDVTSAPPASRSLHLGQQQQHPSKPTSTRSTLAACARAAPLKGRRRAGVRPSCGTDAGARRSIGRGCPPSRDRCARHAGNGLSSALWGLGAATEPLARLAA